MSVVVPNLRTLPDGVVDCCSTTKVEVISVIFHVNCGA